MPSARSVVTIAIISGLTYLALEHFRERRPGTATRVTGLRGVA